MLVAGRSDTMKRTKQQQPDATARMTIRLPAALLKRLKIAAIEADDSLQSFVIKALSRILEKEEGK